MAKSIFKPNVIMTRLEKKKIQKVLAFPKHGRDRYKWRVENRKLGEKYGLSIVRFLLEEPENELQ